MLGITPPIEITTRADRWTVEDTFSGKTVHFAYSMRRLSSAYVGPCLSARVGAAYQATPSLGLTLALRSLILGNNTRNVRSVTAGISWTTSILGND